MDPNLNKEVASLIVDNGILPDEDRGVLPVGGVVLF